MRVNSKAHRGSLGEAPSSYRSTQIWHKDSMTKQAVAASLTGSEQVASAVCCGVAACIGVVGPA